MVHILFFIFFSIHTVWCYLTYSQRISQNIIDISDSVKPLSAIGRPFPGFCICCCSYDKNEGNAYQYGFEIQNAAYCSFIFHFYKPPCIIILANMFQKILFSVGNSGSVISIENGVPQWTQNLASSSLLLLQFLQSFVVLSGCSDSACLSFISC